MEKPAQRRDALWVYLLIANGITWLCWIPALIIARQQGYLLPTIDNTPALAQQGYANAQHRLISSVFSFAVYGPLIGGIVATWLEGGRAGLADLLRRVIKWRVAPKWYGYAVLIATSLTALPVGIALLVNAIPASSLNISRYLPYLALMLGRQLLTSGLGEEPGWRGYLLPKLRRRFQGDTFIWVLGIIWAIWHYPITIYTTLGAFNTGNTAQLIVTLLMSLAGQTISLIGMTYLYVWLYNHTHSILLMMIFHALTNTAATLFAGGLQGPASLLVAAMPWAVVLLLEKTCGKTCFTGSLNDDPSS
ncbi:MAG: CPBP family intramembrane metalloprotease [Anaerolineae bacterium]|nr:CPBP family intramembrane metalloprotease [Anaerolineae bacterium]